MEDLEDLELEDMKTLGLRIFNSCLTGEWPLSEAQIVRRLFSWRFPHDLGIPKRNSIVIIHSRSE
jgi:hypothetical protein